MTRKNQLIVKIILIVILIIAILLVAQYKKNQINKSRTIGENTPLIEDEAKEEENLKLLQQESVTDYLMTNISELSPEKEVLGGTFYVTSIDFIDENNLIIGYEDGHIALSAKVNFEYQDSENIIINSFDIINE